MNDMEEYYEFKTGLDVGLFTIPAAEEDSRWLNWQEYDRGPGIFHIPSDLSLGIRAQFINDDEFKQLVSELKTVSGLRYLYLAENRGITNSGIAACAELTQLRYLNLSSCDINSQGMDFLPALTQLTYLNLSYCNRINEKTAPFVQKLPRLKYLDLHGCIKVNTGGLKKFEKKGLTIYKP